MIYRNMTLTDVWESADEFKTEYKASPLYVQGQRLFDGVETLNGVTQPDNITTLFYLLYSKYAGSPIKNADVNQFKYRLFSIIFQYGPTWQKNLDIQSKLRSISDSELLVGSKVIYNHAYNDASEPTTSGLEEVEYINDQNTANQKKSKMAAYSDLAVLLATDVTELFLNKFKTLFSIFVAPQPVRLYVVDEEDE